jgi:hypothetical protein
MRERGGGVRERASGLAEGLAAVMRRRQQRREPRIVLYDRGGHPRTLATRSPRHAEMLDAAEGLLELVGGRSGGGGSRWRDGARPRPRHSAHESPFRRP